MPVPVPEPTLPVAAAVRRPGRRGGRDGGSPPGAFSLRRDPSSPPCPAVPCHESGEGLYDLPRRVQLPASALSAGRRRRGRAAPLGPEPRGKPPLPAAPEGTGPGGRGPPPARPLTARGRGRSLPRPRRLPHVPAGLRRGRSPGGARLGRTARPGSTGSESEGAGRPGPGGGGR